MKESDRGDRSRRHTDPYQIVAFPFISSVESEQPVGVTQTVTLPHRLVSALVSVSCVTRVVLVGTG